MTSTRPDVSVIVPVYDCEPWLEAQLRSVLDQEGVELEVIAICDGATDGSLAVLESIAARDARVRVVKQENRGVSAARNVGLTLARGEWIVFADGDDWMKPGALRSWIGHGREQGLDVVIGNGFGFDALPPAVDPQPMYAGQPWGEICSGTTWLERTVPGDDWVVCVWLQCVRREFVEKHSLRFEPDVVHEDIIWSLQLALRVQRVGFVREPFYGYRRNPLSITNAPSPAAVARRAAGYLRVIDALVAAALDPRTDRHLSRILLRQANREGGHLLHLLRKRLHDDALRKSVARQFLRSGHFRAMLKGATNASEVWRALRCWRIYTRFAM
ncbi:glycosyltransferase, group 2 family protein [Caballeronia pedi]|uniref:Glycosyltransferase, group 2 family protein n=1 Tax=Caballeronia pedi TaxID=1777141 RepID=A0A158D4Z4_9BURK|nr:glycosyltransferase [Caballeronia pedi]SAK89581.1 glycosyltransferase, group 2 family protein [Caballeronia pedi]